MRFLFLILLTSTVFAGEPNGISQVTFYYPNQWTSGHIRDAGTNMICATSRREWVGRWVEFSDSNERIVYYQKLYGGMPHYRSTSRAPVRHFDMLSKARDRVYENMPSRGWRTRDLRYQVKPRGWKPKQLVIRYRKAGAK